jgi:hypothetical protein
MCNLETASTRKQWERSMNLFGYLIVFVFALLPIRATARTDIFFPDVIAESPNGRYRFSATHANNELERPRPFVSSGFTFHVFDLKAERTVWERPQGKQEPWPGRAFVHDDGLVVVGYARPTVLDRTDGSQMFSWDVFKEFTPDDDRFLVRSESTVGPMVSWSRNSRAYFLEHDGKLYFVLRTWWDRRIWADLTDLRLVGDPSPGLSAAADTSDRRFVLATLEGAAARLAGMDSERDRQAYHSVAEYVQSAIHVAGRIDSQEAIPFLRELEQSEYVGRTGSVRLPRCEDAQGLIAEQELTIRCAAQLALRRLGDRPRGLPCTRFMLKEPGSREIWIPREQPLARWVGPDQVREQQTPMEVITVIGAPDFTDASWPTGKNTWDYDVDTDDPYTLRVHWNDDCRVHRVEVIRPALWKQGETRHMALSNY